MTGEGYSLRRIEWVKAQVLADANALGVSKLLLLDRLRQAKEEGWPLDQWHGMTAVISTLELCLAHLDSRARFYSELINQINLGEVENTDSPPPNSGPSLSVIEGGKA